MIKGKNKTFGRLVVIKDDNSEGSIYPLKKDICVMGRDLNCDVRFDNPVVSRRHCEITFDGNNLPKLIQRSKLNSVLVNGNRIYKDYVLHHNDVITIGVKKLRFELLFNPKKTQTGAENESNLKNESNVLMSEKPHLSTFSSNNCSNCNDNVEINKENEEINISNSFSKTLSTLSILNEKLLQKEEKEVREEKEKEASIIEIVSSLSPKCTDYIVESAKNKDQSIQETSKVLPLSQILSHDEANLSNTHLDCLLVNNKNQHDNKNKETTIFFNEMLTDDKPKDHFSIQNSVNMFVQSQTSDDEKNNCPDKIVISSPNQWLINEENLLSEKLLEEGSFVENQNNDKIEKHESQHEILAFSEEYLSIKLANCSFSENSVQTCSNVYHNTTKENYATESFNDTNTQTNVLSVVGNEHGSYERECLKTPVHVAQCDNKDQIKQNLITNTDMLDKLCFPFETVVSSDKFQEKVLYENKTTNIGNLSVNTKLSHSDHSDITEIVTEKNESISTSNNSDDLYLIGEIENNEADVAKDNESPKCENLEKIEKNVENQTIEDEKFANKTSINDYNQKLVKNLDKNLDKILKSEECEERPKKTIKNLRSAKKKKEMSKIIVENEQENETKKNLGTGGAKSVKVEAKLDVSRCEDEDENESGTIRKSRRARKPPKRFEISW
jgi:PREDICTED: hypothetical protein